MTTTEQARELLRLASQTASSATTPARNLQAAQFALDAMHLSEHGTEVYVSALGHLAIYYARAGKFQHSNRIGSLFLLQYRRHDGLDTLAAYVHYALAFNAYYLRKPAVAALHFAQARKEPTLTARASYGAAWAYGKLGRTAQALAILPASPEPGNVSYWHSAHAFICATLSDWQGAHDHAQSALSADDWQPFDMVARPETLLLYVRACKHTGSYPQAQTGLNEAAQVFAQWGTVALAYEVAVALVLRREEVNPPDAQAASSPAGGVGHRWSYVGRTVGRRVSTGPATAA